MRIQIYVERHSNNTQQIEPLTFGSSIVANAISAQLACIEAEQSDSDIYQAFYIILGES